MRNFEKKSIQSYNEKADNYDNTFDGKFTVRFKQLLLQEVDIRSNNTVLDVACGNGTFLKKLSDMYNINGYGIDISEKMVANARIIAPDMSLEVASCTAIPFKDKLFDVITVCAAYHHFPDVKLFAKEVSRLLKPNGRLYIADVYYPAIFRILLNPFIPLSKAGDVKFYSPKEIVGNFEAVGLTKIKVDITGHVQIVAFQRL